MINFLSEFSLDDRLKMIDIMEKASNIYNQVFEASICYNDKMRTTIGRAYYTRKLIELNTRLIKNHHNELIPTFVHELAHLITRQVYGQRVKGHGKEWQSVMLKLGHKPDRTHNLNVNHLKRKHKRYSAYCDCQVHMITANKVNKISMNICKYRCKKCNIFLKLCEL